MKFRTRIQAGDVVAPRELITIHSERIRVPDPHRLVHLQFRRFAGCPICKLHLRSIAERYDELRTAGILEVAVFHSSVESMLRHEGVLPFAVIADPEKKLYAEFGVETSVLSLLDPRAWVAVVRGIATFGTASPAKGESGLGLPADFLIAPTGQVVACKYGAHADDHWSVDEILVLSGSKASARRMNRSISTDTRRPKGALS